MDCVRFVDDRGDAVPASGPVVQLLTALRSPTASVEVVLLTLDEASVPEESRVTSRGQKRIDRATRRTMADTRSLQLLALGEFHEGGAEPRRPWLLLFWDHVRQGLRAVVNTLAPCFKRRERNATALVAATPLPEREELLTPPPQKRHKSSSSS